MMLSNCCVAFPLHNRLESRYSSQRPPAEQVSVKIPNDRTDRPRRDRSKVASQRAVAKPPARHVGETVARMTT